MSSGMMPLGFFVVGQLMAPAGTRTVFHQAAAPLGWTQEVGASYSDADLRVNNSSPSTGGSANWSGWNGGGVFSCNAITLSVANLPAHSHGVNDPGHSHSIGSGESFTISGAQADAQLNIATTTTSSTSTNSAGLSNNNTGSGGSFTPTFTTPVLKFIDQIIGIKS